MKKKQKQKKPLSRRQVLKILGAAGVTQAAAPLFGASRAFGSINDYFGGKSMYREWHDRKVREAREKKDREDIAESIECDVVLVGAGIMSATLGTMLKELDPSLRILCYERLPIVAGESSGAWNNAGTGHSALCELNYSPVVNGKVDITKAKKITEQFEISKQFWSYLVRQGRFAQPHSFINSVPHMSVVWGASDIGYLKARYDLMKQCHFYKGMEYSEDKGQLAEWAPVMMNGVNKTRPMALSRNELGTDVNFGQITKSMFERLQNLGVELHLSHEVRTLHQDSQKCWHLDIQDIDKGPARHIRTKFVFLGAGGGALGLLEKSGIRESDGYGGFPVTGGFLVCKNEELINRHHAKIYGKAGVGAPPMSVPHLDTRTIDGERVLLFGPFAGFSSKFLKKGSYFDLPSSVVNKDLPHYVAAKSIKSMLGAGAHTMDLSMYLAGQVKEDILDHHDGKPYRRVKALQEFVPDANVDEWELIKAGQRVQVIKGAKKGWGTLEFGTEVVASADGTLTALLGASPGASTAVYAMLDVISKSRFKDQMKSQAWSSKMREMIPTTGQHLIDDAELTERTRAWTHETLGLKRV